MSGRPHPVDPEPFSPEPEPNVGNPTQLPVEPEFGQQLPQNEPEDEPGSPVAPQ